MYVYICVYVQRWHPCGPHALTSRAIIEAAGGNPVITIILVDQNALHAMVVNSAEHSSNGHAPYESVRTCESWSVNDVQCRSIRRSST